MAKIVRKLQKIFALSAANNGVFGSGQTGAKTISTDLDVIQGLAAWPLGWLQAVLAAEKLPPLEEMQSIQYVCTSQLKYLFQEGIPEYLSTDEYHINSIVKKTGTYELYGSKINTNTGNALPAAVSDANWQYLGDLANLGTSVPNVFTFVNATLAAGVLVLNHALGSQYWNVTVIDNNDLAIGNPDSITYTDANNMSVDLSSFGVIAGTWTVILS